MNSCGIVVGIKVIFITGIIVGKSMPIFECNYLEEVVEIGDY